MSFGWFCLDNCMQEEQFTTVCQSSRSNDSKISLRTISKKQVKRLSKRFYDDDSEKQQHSYIPATKVSLEDDCGDQQKLELEMLAIQKTMKNLQHKYDNKLHSLDRVKRHKRRTINNL